MAEEIPAAKPVGVEIVSQIANPPTAVGVLQPDPPPQQQQSPQFFKVKAKDKETGKDFEMTVTKNIHVQTQQDAENHVANMPSSRGGKHDGLEVTKTTATE